MNPARTPILASPVVRAVAPFLDPRTLGSVAHVWLGFPLGLAWFVLLVVGLTTGVALTLVWLGFLILALTLLAAWAAEGLERRLAIGLLGARVPERRARPQGSESVVDWVRSVVGGAALWKGLLYLGLRFPLGLAAWVASVVSLAVSAALLLAPALDALGGDVDLVFFDSPLAIELWLLSLAGFVGLVLSLHAHRLVGLAWAWLAEVLLGAELPGPASAAPEETGPAAS